MRTALTFWTLLILTAVAWPHAASANGLKDSAAGDFADAHPVGDQELAKMRGGFIDINGVLIDISYNATLAVNGTVQNNISLTTADLTQSSNLHNIVPPTVIQNVDNNTLIAMQQQLNLTVNNAASQAASHLQFTQAMFQNSLAFH